MLIKLKKAQNTLEYAVLIAVVAGGLIAVQTYMKRAYQGNLQSSADDVGEQFSAEGLQNLNYSFSSLGTTNETSSGGVQTSRLIRDGEKMHRDSNVQLRNLTNESWY